MPVQEPAAVSPAAAPVQAEAAPKEPVPEVKSAENSLVDQAAQVYHLEGAARILKKGAENWEPLQVGTVINAGDQVKTEADGLVEIHYDSFFLNIAKITPNSLAEFMSIEPTKIFVSSGAIYSSLEGLPEGSTYDVITPTAVGGVRSTVFVRSYDPSTQTDQTIVLEGTVYLAAGTQDASKAAEADIMLIHKDEQFDFTGEELSSGTLKERSVEPMSSEQNLTMRQMFSEAKQRAEVFAGGAQSLSEAHSTWENIKSDPKKLAAVKAKMEISRFYQRIEEKKETLARESAPSPALIPAGKPAQASSGASSEGGTAAQAPDAETLAEDTVNPILEGHNGENEEMAVAGDVYDMEGNPIRKE